MVTPHPNQEALDLLAEWDAEDGTSDPAEIARRNREFEEFRQAINESRLETEGPRARKVYP